MARTDTLTNFLTDVADAIRTKTGESGTIQASSFDTAIASIPSGGGEVEEKDVNYFDYDGTLLYSYTKAEFLELTEHPENPTHSGLTAQGWNWTLTNAKTFVNTYNELDIGQNYITSDGKTKLYIRTPFDNFETNVYLELNVDTTCEIDWGDNTTPDTLTSSTKQVLYVTHTYTTQGNYVINIDVTQGEVFLNYSGNTYSIVSSLTDETDRTFTRDSVYKIEFGSNISVGNYGLYYLRNVETITFPTTIVMQYSNSTYGAYGYYHCESLKCIILPLPTQMMNGISSYAFHYLTEIKRIIFPDILTYRYYNISLPTYTGINLKKFIIAIHNLTNIIIESSISYTYIERLIKGTTANCIGGSNAYQGNYKLKELHYDNSPSNGTGSWNQQLEKVYFDYNATVFYQTSCFSNNKNCILYDLTKNTAVPTLYSGISASGLNKYCKIVVPDDLYEDWIVAQYWSDIASHIVKSSDYYGE